MIQSPQITIEADAPVNFGPTHYRIQIVVPAEIGEMIGMACHSATNVYFHGISAIAGESMDVFDYEFDDTGLLWADTMIGDIATGVMRNEDGSFTLSLICMKQPEGDDCFDCHAYEQKMIGVLPDNFWIEPASLIRKLIAATKH